MRIITPTAVLRDWTLADARGLAQHADNPRVAACMRDGFPSPYTQEDAVRFISFATTPGRHLLLAIEVDGEAVGGIGVHPLEDVYYQTGEIGYWLAEPCWGRGSRPMPSGHSSQSPSARWVSSASRPASSPITRPPCGCWSRTGSSARPFTAGRSPSTVGSSTRSSSRGSTRTRDRLRGNHMTQRESSIPRHGGMVVSPRTIRTLTMATR